MAPGVYQSRFPGQLNSISISQQIAIAAIKVFMYLMTTTTTTEVAAAVPMLLMLLLHRQHPHVTAIWLLAPGAQY